MICCAEAETRVRNLSVIGAVWVAGTEYCQLSENKKKEEMPVVRKTMLAIILAALLTMGLPTVPALAVGQGPRTEDLLIYEVSCSQGGAFSANGFVGKVSNKVGSVIVTIDFTGVCPDDQVLTFSYTQSADLCPLLNPNGKPNGNANGYNWSVEDGIATIPELGPVNWSATHIEVTLTNKPGLIAKETDLPLPCCPF